MIAFPNAKINLGLRITGRRDDGFHDIDTYMFPVNLSDALEIVPSEDGFSFDVSGIVTGIDSENNTCVRAYRLMKDNYNIPDVKIHLHKLIPAQSGLGGGSSDGAFTLVLLRRLFNLKICNNELEEMAFLLGSDCPFFIVNKPQLVTGRGKPTHKFWHPGCYYIVVIVPELLISTKWAYSIIEPTGRKLPELSALSGNEINWSQLLINDFEDHIFAYYPQLKEIKENLLSEGAFYTSLSGSGSAIYGLFREKPRFIYQGKGFYWQGELIK